MLVLPADHVIRDVAGVPAATWRPPLTAAEETGALVTIGIKPTWACPGFGYIEMGDAVASRSRCRRAVPGDKLCNVRRFREKPRAGTRPGVFRPGELPLERGDVRLDLTRCAPRTERANPGAGRLCLAGAQREGFHRAAGREVSAPAENFHRLRHHGERRPGLGAGSWVRLG